MISTESGEYLPSNLFSYLRSAELDYVVLYRALPNRPLLAVEFDGPHHELDVRARRNDLLKNRLCRMAGLPLLRIRSDDIKPFYRRDTFLSYIVGVILRYKGLHEKKDYAPPRHPDEFTEREYDELRRHDLTDIRRLQDSIARKYRVGPWDQAAESASAVFASHFSMTASDYVANETAEIHNGQLTVARVERTLSQDRWPLVYRVSRSVSLRTHYRTAEQPRPRWPRDSSDLAALEAYVKWLETDPWYFPDLPGINWLYVAWNILEVLCLRQLLNEADTGQLLLQ